MKSLREFLVSVIVVLLLLSDIQYALACRDDSQEALLVTKQAQDAEAYRHGFTNLHSKLLIQVSLILIAAHSFGVLDLSGTPSNSIIAQPLNLTFFNAAKTPGRSTRPRPSSTNR